MLAKKKRFNLRLLNLADFFTNSTRINNRFFQAYYLVSKKYEAISQEKCQMSVVVSKKVSLLAVKRNQLKRKVYAVLDQYYDQLKILVKPQQIFQLAIFMKKSALEIEPQYLKQQLEKLVKQLISQLS